LISDQQSALIPKLGVYKVFQTLRQLESGLSSFEEKNPTNNLVSEKPPNRHHGAPFLIGVHTESLIKALEKI